MTYFITACEDATVVTQLRPFSTLCYSLQIIVFIVMSPGDEMSIPYQVSCRMKPRDLQMH